MSEVAASQQQGNAIDPVGVMQMTALEFEIRVAGVLPPDVLEELEHLRVVTQSTETVLQGPVTDQAALVGIINRLQGLGIELREVRQLGAGTPASPGTSRAVARRSSCRTTRSGSPARSGRWWRPACPGSRPPRYPRPP